MTPSYFRRIIYRYYLYYFFLISEKTYKEISQNKQDKTYVRTSAVEKAMKFLHEHGVVFLSGREGTGKSKMCLEIASLCEEKDYMPYKVDGYGDLKSILSLLKFYVF